MLDFLGKEGFNFALNINNVRMARNRSFFIFVMGVFGGLLVLVGSFFENFQILIYFGMVISLAAMFLKYRFTKPLIIFFIPDFWKVNGKSEYKINIPFNRHHRQYPEVIAFEGTGGFYEVVGVDNINITSCQDVEIISTKPFSGKVVIK